MAAQAAPPSLQGLGLDETLAGEAVTAEALNAAVLRGSDLPLFARVVIEQADIEGDAERRFDRLDERLERYRLKGVPVVLALADPLPSALATEPWRLLVRAMAERYRGRIRAYELTVRGPPGATARDVAFVLKLGAVQVRAADPDASLAVGPVDAADAGWLESLYSEEMAAYVDAVVVRATTDADATLRAVEAIVDREDPDAVLIAAGVPLPPDPDAAATALVDWQVSHLGGKVALTTYGAASASMAKGLGAAARLKDLLTAEVVPLDEKATGLKLTLGDQDVTTAVAHRMLYDLGDFTTYLIYGPGSGLSGRLAVQMNDPTGLKPSLRDPIGGKPSAGLLNQWDASAHLARLTVPLLDRPLLVQLSYGGDTSRTSRTEVKGSVLPSVAEIVFRHQEVQAAQDERLSTVMAEARMESHFRPSSDYGVDVVTENHFYSDREGSEYEETSFLLNGTRWGPKRPAFPMLQSDKVLSLPLDLRLSQDYRYRLEGLEKVDGRDAYAVRFDPLDESRTLYRGTVWIDAANFAKLKVQAVETHVTGVLVSHEEIQFFTPEAEVDGLPVYLLSRFNTQQVMLIAGRNLQVERVVRFTSFAVNAPDFEARRAASRAGDNIMYRDTASGLRDLVKRGDARVVATRDSNTVKAVAAGVIVDPSYDFPLPVLGFNYLKFGHDNQLAVLFGGVLLLGNVQRPKAIGDKIDLNADLFAIAVASNDQIFDAQGEREDERLRDLPFSTGLNMGWQINPFHKLTAGYLFRFDAYSRADETAPDFAPPADTVTNGLGLIYEYRRRGYIFQASGFYFVRSSWEPWGKPGDYRPEDRTYEKYSVSLTKDFFFKAVHKFHLNAAYFGGQHLDRFNEYQSGLFEDNRIHGVPASGVRFSEAGMGRFAYSFNVFDIYGIDLFFDQAWIREPRQMDWQPITGLGFGFNLRAPWSTLARGEIGKSFLPAAYSGAGSFVARITFLKPL